MTISIRNLVIGAILLIVIAAGAGIALSSGGDDDQAATDATTTTLASDDTSAEASESGGSGGSGGAGSTGGSGGGDQGGGNQGGGDGNATAPEDDDGEEAPPEPAPTVALINQRCSGGKLIASITASASNAYRKGVQSVSMSRKNDENADISANAVTWLGPETGAGDVWDGTLNYGNNFGKVLRVVATSDSGQSTTKEFAISVPC
ncbi:MAG: hypothetical protein FJW86_08100 [Actinobacteria bacterium]|nr:hypothetical protein [Actinomycetota bacterium]